MLRVSQVQAFVFYYCSIMSGLTENHKHVRRRLEPLRLATGKLSSPPPQSHVQEMPRICVSVVEAFGVQYRGGTIFDAGMDWTCGGKKSYLANRFVEECVRLSQLRHPNVVMLYGIVMDGPSLTLAMELPAANLDEILCHYNYIPEFMKTSMLLDAARGLLYLHKQKPTVAHNRVSTRAVYVSPSMSAKIGDVGVAGALCESTAENSATVGKMPPQALIKILETGTKYADTQVDVPAFGNVIVHTLCQRRWLDPPGHTALSPYLHTVPIHHPLYSLAYHCLLGGIQMSIQKPIPQVDMEYVVQCLQRAANDNPMPFTNTLELLQTLSLEVQRNGKHLKKNSTSMHQHNSSIHHGQDSTLPVSDVHKNFNVSIIVMDTMCQFGSKSDSLDNRKLFLLHVCFKQIGIIFKQISLATLTTILYKLQYILCKGIEIIIFMFNVFRNLQTSPQYQTLTTCIQP